MRLSQSGKNSNKKKERIEHQSGIRIEAVNVTSILLYREKRNKEKKFLNRKKKLKICDIISTAKI